MTSVKSLDVERRLNALITEAGPVAAAVNLPDVTSTGNQELSHLTIPAGTIAGGERYEGIACGGCSTGGSAPTGMTWTVYANGVGSGTIAQLQVPAAGLVSGLAGAGWLVEFDVFWMSPTEAECALRVWWRTGSGVSATVPWFTVQNQTGIDSGTDMNMTLAFGFTGTGVDLQTKACHISRRA